MGQRPRAKPEHLAAKLFAIRQRLGLSQSQMAKVLEFKVSYSRVSECESGVREPNLLVLLSYARIAGVHMETLVNDRVELPNK
jgi:transcriptional regulator with XRE-family HTH domain